MKKALPNLGANPEQAHQWESVRPNRLKEHRKSNGYGQADVAKYLGIDQTTVSNHESGRRQLTGDMIRDYAKLYQISALDIFHKMNDDGSVPPEA